MNDREEALAALLAECKERWSAFGGEKEYADEGHNPVAWHYGWMANQLEAALALPEKSDAPAGAGSATEALDKAARLLCETRGHTGRRPCSFCEMQMNACFSTLPAGSDAPPPPADRAKNPLADYNIKWVDASKKIGYPVEFATVRASSATLAGEIPESLERKTGWMDSIDFEHEAGYALGGNKIYPDASDLRRHSTCIDKDGHCFAKRVYVVDADAWDAILASKSDKR